MNWLKFILIALGLLLVVMLVSSVVGIVYSAFWYLVVIGVIGVGGYVGYQFFKKDKDSLKLEEKKPSGISELKNRDRALEEYKRRVLPK